MCVCAASRYFACSWLINRRHTARHNQHIKTNEYFFIITMKTAREPDAYISTTWRKMEVLNQKRHFSFLQRIHADKLLHWNWEREIESFSNLMNKNKKNQIVLYNYDLYDGLNHAVALEQPFCSFNLSEGFFFRSEINEFSVGVANAN